MVSIERLYGEFWAEGGSEADKMLEQSRSPRPRAFLQDLFGKLGVGPNSAVLDIGCRDASLAVKLAQQFACHVVGVDPIPGHLETAVRCIQEAGLENSISVRLGRIEAVPAEDDAFDYIWSRDMLNHVDLHKGFQECKRVLRPNGKMLAYVTLQGSAMEPAEAKRIYQALAIRPENMLPTYFEEMVEQSGLKIVERHVIASEWWEADLETAEARESLGKSCLDLTRLSRGEAEFVERFGRERYEAMYYGELWGLYIVLGKLCPMIYVLEKGESHSRG